MNGGIAFKARWHDTLLTQLGRLVEVLVESIRAIPHQITDGTPIYAILTVEISTRASKHCDFEAV